MAESKGLTIKETATTSWGERIPTIYIGTPADVEAILEARAKLRESESMEGWEKEAVEAKQHRVLGETLGYDADRVTKFSMSKALGNEGLLEYGEDSQGRRVARITALDKAQEMFGHLEEFDELKKAGASAPEEFKKKFNTWRGGAHMDQAGQWKLDSGEIQTQEKQMRLREGPADPESKARIMQEIEKTSSTRTKLMAEIGKVSGVQEEFTLKELQKIKDSSFTSEDCI